MVHGDTLAAEIVVAAIAQLILNKHTLLRIDKPTGHKK